MAIVMDSLIRSADWASIGMLPEQAAANINNAGFWIQGGSFTPAGNILTGQIMKTAMTYFDDMQTGSLYGKYTKKVGANMPFGQYLEQIHVEPARAQDYKTGAPNGDISPYKRTEPEVKVLYNPINLDVQFPVSVNIPDIQGAFVASGGIDNYLKQCAKSLFAGADDLSDTMFLALLGELATIAQNSPNQSVIVDKPVDQATSLEFIAKIHALISRWRIRDSKFNSMGARQKYAPSDLVLFIRDYADSYANVWRSTAFHRDLTEMGVEVDVVPDFEGITAVTDATPALPLYPLYDKESGKRVAWTVTAPAGTDADYNRAKYTGNVISQDPNKSIAAVLCSKKCPIVLTQFEQLTEDFNSRTLTKNYFLTQRKLFGITPFHNAVAFSFQTTP